MSHKSGKWDTEFHVLLDALPKTAGPLTAEQCRATGRNLADAALRLTDSEAQAKADLRTALQALGLKKPTLPDTSDPSSVARFLKEEF
jgi:hypothetical protein